ncbi:MAG: phosphoribosylaminoimidazolesuccinocarboxamide synthase [Nitrospirae bacterium]|nr:MAG: phosphoribosylaminoimidazolesuccinocarboxamide synthase [Nitrospirota bacterium]
MQAGEQLYEGKAKILYATDDPGRLVQHFKDDATAFNAQKRGTIHDKGVVNNRMSERLFRYLEAHGVHTHFLERLDDRRMLVRRLEMLPIEVIVRNRIAGSLARRLGLPEGTEAKRRILEFCLKSDELGDPLITEDHILALELVPEARLAEVKAVTAKVAELLTRFFAERGLELVDFKLEYGIDPEGRLTLGDEICPDTMRLWDVATGEKKDKDRFRHDLGGVEEAYHEVLERVLAGDGDEELP